MLGQLFAVVVGGIVGYEALKKYKALTQTVSMMQGHLYSIGLNYTTDPPTPPTQASVQSLLDAAEPGGMSVLSVAMTPGPQSGIRQMALSVQRTGATKQVPASTFTSGWDSTFGTVTLAATQDMGNQNSAAAHLLGL